MKDSTKRVMLDGAVGGLFGASAIVAWPAIVGGAAGTLLGFHAAFGSADSPLHFAAYAGIGEGGWRAPQRGQMGHRGCGAVAPRSSQPAPLGR